MLGRRHDRRLRCVCDDDAAARRGVDVDVVDSHAGPSDHLQPVGPCDQLGRQLRRRADHDRLVAADRLREVGFAVDVDLEAALAQETNPGVSDLFADEDGAHRADTAR